jgi:hypothetical protein
MSTIQEREGFHLVKTSSMLLIASTVALGAMGAAPVPAADPRPEIQISELTPERFELVYSGTQFASRDAVEGQLLLSSARLALAHGRDSFVLLAMPGERPDVHPARPNPGFGASYGHWQPHWNYYLPSLGWQWWHPEWGADFWTADVDPNSVERFTVHAMIDLGRGAGAPRAAPRFDARLVVRDLNRVPDVGLERTHP